jgi:sulfite reductase beta subunit-like hemoprotein
LATRFCKPQATTYFWYYTCPGTDTCNLGIASSTGIAVELERVLTAEYPQYSNNREITIKISGCMNAWATQYGRNWLSRNVNQCG